MLALLLLISLFIFQQMVFDLEHSATILEEFGISAVTINSIILVQIPHNSMSCYAFLKEWLLQAYLAGVKRYLRL